ncbi:MAG: ATP-binding protein [Paludibacteraceae bacterium]|nr:ATP-binding protein [Paludibacteraceae bacterium]
MNYNVAIIGPESSGKSTLARYLANRYGGILVPEYARRYVEDKGSTEVSYEELCTIARKQIQELEYLSANEVKRSVSETVCQAKPVFFDTELIVTKVWFDYAFGRVPEWLNDAILRFPMDVYLLTYPDLPWIPDPTRTNGSDAIRLELFRRYEAEIQALNIPYYIIKHQ